MRWPSPIPRFESAGKDVGLLENASQVPTFKGMVDMVDAISDGHEFPEDFAHAVEACRPQIVALLTAISDSREFAEEFARTMEGPQIVALLTGFGQAICALEVWRQRRLKLYPQLLAEVPALTRRSWFISGYFGLSEIEELARICGTVTPDVLDSHVANMYRTSLAEHGESLLHDYPTRVFAIQPAIAAHERQEYALSVQTFLTQADGICYDRAKK
jgi:hypothetical protein